MSLTSLTTKNFSQYVTEMTSTWVNVVQQIVPGLVPSFVSGSPILALFQSLATELLFLQSNIQTVALAARLSTSGVGPGMSGDDADVDSFVADFGLQRIQATVASGQVLFSTLSPNTFAAIVPIGATVQTLSGQVQYQVVVDTTNLNYSATSNGYVLPAAATSISVTVNSIGTGTTQNVQANTLVVLTQNIPGITNVTNVFTIDNAVNAETSPALKARFAAYLGSLSQATSEALDYYIGQTAGVTRWIKLENTNPAGATQLGYFTIYVDDGTGNPPPSLITAVSNAVAATRGFSIQYSIQPPNVTAITISVTVVHNPATQLSTAQIQTEIQTALINYINAQGFGQTVYYTFLYDLIFDACQHAVGNYSSNDILKVSSLSLNSGSGDITSAASYVPIVSSVTVNVS